MAHLGLNESKVFRMVKKCECPYHDPWRPMQKANTFRGWQCKDCGFWYGEDWRRYELLRIRMERKFR